jgi:hypothetical protein
MNLGPPLALVVTVDGVWIRNRIYWTLTLVATV